jgi:hypothetical protein
MVVMSPVRLPISRITDRDCAIDSRIRPCPGSSAARRPRLFGVARDPPRHLVGLPRQRRHRLDRRSISSRWSPRRAHLGDPRAALRHALHRSRHLLDRGEFCSTAVASRSVIAPTSSIDAAISLIDDEVSSAAPASRRRCPTRLDRLRDLLDRRAGLVDRRGQRLVSRAPTSSTPPSTRSSCVTCCAATPSPGSCR